MIKIAKSGFKMVPEGEQVITVKSVKALPSASTGIEFEWVHANGGTIKESFKTSCSQGNGHPWQALRYRPQRQDGPRVRNQ